MLVPQWVFAYVYVRGCIYISHVSVLWTRMCLASHTSIQQPVCMYVFIFYSFIYECMYAYPPIISPLSVVNMNVFTSFFNWMCSPHFLIECVHIKALQRPSIHHKPHASQPKPSRMHITLATHNPYTTHHWTPSIIIYHRSSPFVTVIN
jgi:hypothetical protein